MKNRTSQDGRDDNGEKTTKKQKNYGPNLAMMKKNNNKKRLGGGGLSLEAFANAKTKSGYNPAVIKKQREFYKNAKCVNKYRKSQKQEHNVQQTEQNRQRSRFSIDTTKPPQEGNQTGEGKKIHKKNNNNSLQSLREAYEKKREEEEKAKMEKEALLQAKKEQREMSETLRKERREQMFKKTRSGQPVMKFRIEQILKTLQGSTK